MIILRFDSFSGTLEKIQTSGRRSSAFNSDQQQIHPYNISTLLPFRRIYTVIMGIIWLIVLSKKASSVWLSVETKTME